MELKQKITVTIAIGIICSDGILMGSDSRTTNPDHTIKDSAKKIRGFVIRDFDCVMIAQSGDDDLGSRVVDGIENLAKDADLANWQSVSDIGDKVIAEEIRKLRIPFEGPSFDAEKFQDILRRFDCSFMIAHHFKGKPYIFSTDFYPGRFSRRNSTHFAIGCGSPLANFLLEGFNFEMLSTHTAAPILIYIIEQVKRFDPRCGGPTKIFINGINRQTKVTFEGQPDRPAEMHQTCGIFSDERVNEHLEDISELQKSIRNEWVKMLSRIAEKDVEKFIKSRCTGERFIRMRYGVVILEALNLAGEFIAKSGNEEADKQFKELHTELSSSARKVVLKDLWGKICQILPGVTELPDVGKEISKLF